MKLKLRYRVTANDIVWSGRGRGEKSLPKKASIIVVSTTKGAALTEGLLAISADRGGEIEEADVTVTLLGEVQ